MWGWVVLIPDHCLSNYFTRFQFRRIRPKNMQFGKSFLAIGPNVLVEDKFSRSCTIMVKVA